MMEFEGSAGLVVTAREAKHGVWVVRKRLRN